MGTILQSVGRGGANIPSDVLVVQALINKNIAQLTPLRPLRVDGCVGPKTIAALEAFQSRVAGLATPDGRVDPHGKTLAALTRSRKVAQTSAPVPLGSRPVEKPAPQWLTVAAGEATWLSMATAEEGEAELPGAEQNNPRIVEYLSTVPGLMAVRTAVKGVYAGELDETAWCACFVNWCLIQAGYPSYPAARALDWMRYGRALDTPVPGAITILYKKPRTRADRKTTASGYHVGFYVSGEEGSMTLFGGNQGDRVCEKRFVGWRLEGFRWPL